MQKSFLNKNKNYLKIKKKIKKKENKKINISFLTYLAFHVVTER